MKGRLDCDSDGRERRTRELERLRHRGPARREAKTDGKRKSVIETT
jgi:hypothetical protein